MASSPFPSPAPSSPARRRHGMLRPPRWRMTTECERCRIGFSFFTRDHHCRACGGNMCSTCAGRFVPLLKFGLFSPVRVCEDCYESVYAEALRAAQAERKVNGSSTPRTSSTSGSTTVLIDSSFTFDDEAGDDTAPGTDKEDGVHRLSPRAKSHLRLQAPSRAGKGRHRRTTSASRFQQEAIARALDTMFEEVDANKDGFISRAEFEMFLDRLGLSGERAELFLAAVDVQDEDELDFDRFQRGVLQMLDPYQVSTASEKTRINVFLGGACGATTWRRDEVIPRLERHAVSYYNPQVENWSPHLVVLESLMKACCSQLLFVIDGNTRGLASMIEASLYIGEDRDVVLVINDVKEGAVIEGEEVTEAERRDLNRARHYLATAAELHHVAVHKTIASAVESIVQRYSQNGKFATPRKEKDGHHQNNSPPP